MDNKNAAKTAGKAGMQGKRVRKKIPKTGTIFNRLRRQWKAHGLRGNRKYRDNWLDMQW